MEKLIEAMEVAVRDHDWLRVRVVLAEMKAALKPQAVENADEKPSPRKKAS